ncbi:MAG TPA: hypothetical protein VGH02_00930 [Rhizomicrobium sp.]|jgi:hypothetical protein
MPDFEIRYYRSDGRLAFVHMCALPTLREAQELAQQKLGDYAQFKIIDRKVQPVAMT